MSTPEVLPAGDSEKLPVDLAPSAEQQGRSLAPSIDPAPWWHSAVVYQVYPRSFADRNGDGEGDLQGVISRLSYLASLGVSALWLSPFYPSPMVDAGYDVSDPRAVDPRYGTLDDARELVEQAHARGMRVIVDVVPNHVSSAHRWFVEALAAPPGSAARARFHFRDGRGDDGELPPTNWVSVFSGPAWTRVTEPDGTAGQWYLHLFDSAQPDLNWDHPEVREDALETLRFWLDLGVDGFRIDVAFGLSKDMSYPDVADPVGVVEGIRMDLYDGSPQSRARRLLVAESPFFDRSAVQEIYREWRELLDSYAGDRMTVAEAWVYPPERARAYVAGDTLHQIFNFDLLVAPWDAGTIQGTIQQTLDVLDPVGAPPTWALSNHDTSRVVTRLGGGPRGRRRARALAMLVHALPGSVYVFQGEELGLEDAHVPPELRQDPVWFRSGGTQVGRDGARVPLPWGGDRTPFDFSDEDSWLPQPDDWADLTVAAQEGDSRSTLALYRATLRLRRAHPGLGADEDLRWLRHGSKVVAFERGAGFVSITNLSGRRVHVDMTGVVLLASGRGVESSAGRITVPAETTVWLQT